MDNETKTVNEVNPESKKKPLMDSREGTPHAKRRKRRQKKKKKAPISYNELDDVELNKRETDKYNKYVLDNVRAVISHGNPLEKYDHLEEIAEGGLAKVYRGQETEAGREVAIKMIPIRYMVDGYLLLPRCDKELINLKNTNHENVTRYIDSYLKGSIIWLVQEFVDGINLFQARLFNMDTKVITAVCHQILRALEHIHGSHLIHRDIKSANILLSKNGEVKITDFGLSITVAPNLKSCVGSACWMAPELVSTTKYDTKVDIWALGITVLELLRGTAPYEEESEQRTKELVLVNGKPEILTEDEVDPEIADFLDRCLEPNPAKRASATELLGLKMFTNNSSDNKETVATFVNGLLNLN